MLGSHTPRDVFTRNGLRNGASFCSFISLLLVIISLATDHWVVSTVDYMGLWGMRGSNGNYYSFGMHAHGYIHTTRAFLLIGMLADAVALFGLCASYYQPEIGPISAVVLALRASLTAGVSSLVAMSTFTGIYTTYFLVPGVWFGWSFGSGWASSALFFITGGLAYKIVSSTTQG